MKKSIKILLIVLIATTVSAQSNSGSVTSSDINIVKVLMNSNITERLITSSAIVAEISILFLVLYYWKKTKKEKLNGSDIILKRNIKAIREERINPNMMNIIRKNKKSSFTFIKPGSFSSKQLTKKARKLSIAKGEILLVARIKQIQNQIT